MAEMDLTKKITSVIKAADKLVQDVLKIKEAVTNLKDSLKKPEDKSKD
jgi:hypothetical protein